MNPMNNSCQIKSRQEKKILVNSFFSSTVRGCGTEKEKHRKMGLANGEEFPESHLDYLLGKCTQVMGRSVQA